MKVKIYQVDAFTDTLFSGNPAAVCPLKEHWLADATMQKIAFENNLAETAFFIRKDNRYHIRWFTPSLEVDLCGHATLASAHVLFNHEQYDGSVIEFSSRSGILTVKKESGFLTMDFPADTIGKTNMTEGIMACFDLQPQELYKGKTDYLLVYENEEQIRNIRCNLARIAQIKARGIIITAPGNNCDLVSRFFAPQSGVDEDPVTGSAHTTLTPYWSRRFNKIELRAVQLSKRGGYLICRNKGERVEISGKAVTYMTGEIIVP